MAEWVQRADRCLDFNKLSVLSGPQHVSASAAERVSAERYAGFDVTRRALEVEQAAAEELQDLQERTDVEWPRTDRGESKDGH